MTTNKLFTSLLLVAFAALLSTSFTSCKKDDDDDDHKHEEGTGHLHVYFKNKMNGMDLMYDHTHTLSDGREFNFSTVQYYVSNLRLVKADGTEHPMEGIFELVKGGATSELELEDVPGGNYSGIKFNVGVDSTTNKTVDPATQPEGSALGVQNPSMYWSWNSGYIFLRLEGNVDTAAVVGNSPEMGTFTMHVGSDPNLMDISLDKNFAVGENEHPSVSVFMDAQYLIDTDLDMSTSADRNTHTMDNMPLVMKLKANIDGAFSAQ